MQVQLLPWNSVWGLAYEAGGPPVRVAVAKACNEHGVGLDDL